MKKSTTITYNFETNEDYSKYELEYKDYVKNANGEENLLHYKNNVKNNTAIDNEKNINELKETFNKICKFDNKIDETIGVSSNNDDWKIHEYKNHKFDKEYVQEYDTIKFDINYDLLQKKETKNYIKDNK
jgi:hypothetical protein